MTSTGVTKQDDIPIAHRLLRQDVSTNKVLSHFIALCKHVRDKQEPAADSVLLGLLKELSLLEFQARRHALAEQANVHDRQLYETKQAQLEHEIEQAQIALTASKLDLKEAREEKQRKNECEIRRLRCTTQPKRSSTATEIAAVNQELQAVQTETELVLQDQELRKKKLAVLLRMVDELEADLAEEPPEAADQEMQSNASDHEGSDKDLMQE